ncbi:polysaccharide biosynthesis protein GumN [Rhodanobacter sp. FW510-R12]|uniref:TraB/GumN family protein n=1 Tax=unclassified Rhodanobacter TaxID=2621553 RepID=UPI0007A9F1FD|nr:MULTISPECIES: TraB/GumN family protein [unclassified Rhodanobacter]KZC17614.1 polysaccharide biosynthesis protein GumN [Rhodanobacter sp. FW104-R8]KZC25479.1 polysaccharide biosynthesis protein GumN [Rhodanobacter sp. FW510-T8]KZC32230.1 polysaccharide biosynthesis protein GumN [Rhodanobacter sp. FW510-R10]
MRLLHVAFLFALGGMPPAFAQSAAAPPPEVANLPVVVVSGVQPGPGLWKVSKDGHVMWVLGTLSPLPRAMQWQSREVEQVLGASQQVLREPSVQLKADVGFLGKLFLLPSAYSARKNDDGATLQQVLPPPVYARWQVLKLKYLGDDRGVERWRPLFAAQELYKKALKANGLSRSGGVEASVDELAKRSGVPELPTDYHVLIEHPRAAIKAFKQAAPRDTTCFIRTLDSVEHDMPAMTARANAWATGDLQALRELPDSDRHDACVAAVAGAGFAQTLGLDDVPAKQRATWLAAARKALAGNAQTFALLPMDELLKPDGYLAALQAEGYQVDAPE